jgi:hypothetical protein
MTLPTTTTKTRLAIDILGAAAFLGCAGDLLLRAEPWGVNATAAVAALLATLALLTRRHATPVPVTARWLALAALLLGFAFMLRDAAALVTLDILALLVLLALGAASLQGRSLTSLLPFDFLWALIVGGAATIVGSVLLVGQDVRWEELRAGSRFRRLQPVVLGIVLALPLLFVFGALFASADRVFGQTLETLIAVDLETVASHGALIAFLALLAAGYLRWSLIARGPGPLPALASGGPALGIVPVATAVGLLNVLFLLFVLVQIRYFFGGAALVERTTGLTYAEYAREGFFQLVAASVLTLPVILGANHAVRHETPRNVRIFRVLAAVLLLLLGVIMTSAFERVRLYVAAYGLSESRLYATAFMILLVWVFGWLAWTTLRGRGHRFVFGALVQTFAALVALHAVNPDAFIVRANLNRAPEERPFDAAYAVTLGADAVPPLLQALPTLEPAARCLVATTLLDRWSATPARDWRTWNRARARAIALVDAQRAALEAATCPLAGGAS